MKINFERIIKKQTVKGFCKECGKKRSRTIISEQTVNPYNRHKDGRTKNRDEVIDSVIDNLNQAVKNANENFFCVSCKKYLK